MERAGNKRILLVEDDVDDVFLIRHAFQRAGLNDQLSSAENGKAAVTLFETFAAQPDRKDAPEFIFLDLNMPIMNGLDFLRWLRSAARWRTLPVVILTTSEDPRDISAAYELGANAYLVKPSSPAAMTDMFKTVASFWFALNRSPQ
jgi:two-component system, response regulator